MSRSKKYRLAAGVVLGFFCQGVTDGTIKQVVLFLLLLTALTLFECAQEIDTIERLEEAGVLEK